MIAKGFCGRHPPIPGPSQSIVIDTIKSRLMRFVSLIERILKLLELLEPLGLLRPPGLEQVQQQTSDRHDRRRHAADNAPDPLGNHVPDPEPLAILALAVTRP